jgi:cellulose synthase/poly-beta-1,6-N-acetylglucosamine synthase-like glycosyltransferase
MQIFSLIILLFYIILILKYRSGWNKIKQIITTDFTPKVSIIIAMRNEENEIKRLLKSFQSQIYPTDKLEFILVNDHSTDNTLKLLEKSELGTFQIIDLLDGECGKKNAIKKAVDFANGEIILASDADCSFTPYWIQTMVNYFADEKVKLVSGPVTFYKKKSIFQSLQALEFTSLIASGAGAIGSGNAIFCNGANMAYRKDVFLEANNFESDDIASGDDVFFLHSVKSKYPDSIAFANDENAIVTTNSAQTISGFINQRKRWTAKSSRYKDIASVYTSYLVLFVNLVMVLLFTMAFLSKENLQFFILVYFVKFIADLFLLYPVLRFFKRKDLIKLILPFELFYSFYIVLIVILSFSNKFEWKDRTHSR